MWKQLITKMIDNNNNYNDIVIEFMFNDYNINSLKELIDLYNL